MPRWLFLATLALALGEPAAALAQPATAIQRRAYGLRDEEYLRLKVLTCMLPTM
jgi:hypothetical protein